MSSQRDNIRRLVANIVERAAGNATAQINVVRQEIERQSYVSGSGTAGQVAYFDGNQSITSDPALQWNGTTLAITGTLTASSPINVPSGGTGAATLTSGGVLLGNGTAAISATAAGAANAVLRVPSGGGTPGFGAIDLSSAAAVSGTLADARLSSNVALRNVDNSFTAAQTLINENANTSAALNSFILRRRTTGTAVAGIGVQMTFTVEDSAGNDQISSILQSRLNVATAATWQGRMQMYVGDYNNAAREFFRADADGTSARISWFASATVAKQTVTGSRGGNAALASLLTALSNYGLITDSSTA